jgi:hypothetical protein
MNKLISPFLERHLLEDMMAHSLRERLQREIEIQQEEIKLNLRKHIQVKFNEMYCWNASDIPNSVYILLRSVIMRKNTCNPLLANDIALGNYWIVHLASEEYRFQKKEVKLGRRKHIQVDLNVLYC